MILGILQARTSSSRLPQKVLKPILGKPMLTREIERIRQARLIDRLLVATSDDPSDDPIQDLCNKSDTGCFRGEMDDVLDRFYKAALTFLPEYVVRLTGDCPLSDPEIIDQVVRFCVEGRYDYASNTLEPTYPDGLDVEVFRFSCLKQAWEEAELFSQREHVTPFIWQQPERFKIGSFKNEIDLSFLRWTVDEALDYELVKIIYEQLYPVNPHFGTRDVLELIELIPELKTMNTMYKRNEGFVKSLRKDRIIAYKKTGK